jgi:hypothetical protein
MIYQRCYDLYIEEQKDYFSAVIRHCNCDIEYVFEWDKTSTQNEFSGISETRREFKKFFKKEFYGRGLYIYDHEISSIKKVEQFTPCNGGYLIFVPIEWHEYINNWLELTSPEEVSSEEEEELFSLWREKFPSFDLKSFYGYSAVEAFGEVLASYL